MSGPLLDSLAHDIRFGARLLLKDRWFTAAAVLVLGLGIGVNTTIFTIVNGMSWRGLPVERPEQILQIASLELEGERQEMYTSYADFRDWQSAVQTFSGLAAYATASMNLGDEQRPADRLAGMFISAHAFGLLRVRPLVGRELTAEDDQPGAAPVIVLSHGVWTTRYGADPAIVGQVIRVNGTPTAVVGVMPEGFRFPRQTDAWQPLEQLPGLVRHMRDRRRISVFGRTRDGVSLEQARAEMATIASALAAQYPDTNDAVGTRTQPFTEAYVRPPSEDGPPLLMMTAAAFVLLIVCANVANLLLARAAHRAREMAMRAALGASRLRLVRQLLIENVILAAPAALLGLGISMAAVRVFAQEAVDLQLPYWIAFEFDARVFAYLASVCLGTAIAFGLGPAWQQSKTTARTVSVDGPGSSAAFGRHAGAWPFRHVGWSGGLLIAEIALTLVLLAGAGLLVRSGLALNNVDSVLDLRALVTARLALPPEKYGTPEERRLFYARLEERLSAVGTIASGTVASARPFVDAQTRRLVLESGATTVEGPRTVQWVAVGDRYFETLNLTLLRGRALGPGDGVAGPDTAVVNERFAALHLGSGDPVGRRMRLAETTPGATPGPWLTIVGVSPSVRQQPMGDVRAVVYVPLRTEPEPNVSLVLRGAGDATAVAQTVREELRALDPDVAAFVIEPLERLSEKSRWIHRILSLVLAVFAVIGTAVSAMGLYAVTAYGVAQRTAEIGIRMALGAKRSQVAWLFLRRTLIHVALGLAIGMAGALAVGQVLRGLLIRTSATDPVTFIGIMALLITVAAAACIVPARRATRLDPITALRHD